ncbi:S1 family peptidase [Corynebacterium durum]|jgi:putative peptidase cgl1093|uniref:Trypsin n=1 Tax=Corynebacterium durum F0235 TaxID=1035195 RepID=L1MND5_9CORY|nr:S1 family peptidase [Corynebacterium durum]EKX92469.1 trypsin [Corynebacterium durum F0235]MDO4652892.1 S1 family peptidase [Corynebacterium durum]NYI72976.1 hypothetical protein [Corynebacterium durum]WJY84701.1 putative peptidase precursor [Corynebacterium durum]
MPNHAIRRTSLALATATLTAAAMLGTISPASAISGGRNADGDVAATASARVILGNTDCSATRISPEWLITAKHCVGQGNRSLVSLGGNRQGEQRHAAEVVMHPTADLAVIKLDQPSNGPVAKLSGQHLTPGTHARAVGWGGGTQNYFPMVQQGDLEVQRRVFNIDPDNREADLLEVWVTGGHLTPGDSGGPLLIGDTIAGVASMSNENALPHVNGSIGWYVPVAEHTEWITRQTGVAATAAAGQPTPRADILQAPAVQPRSLAPAVGSSAVDSWLSTLPFRITHS